MNDKLTVQDLEDFDERLGEMQAEYDRLLKTAYKHDVDSKQISPLMDPLTKKQLREVGYALEDLIKRWGDFKYDYNYVLKIEKEEEDKRRAEEKFARWEY